MSPSPQTPGDTAALRFDLDTAAHLHSLAERIHGTADALPQVHASHPLASVSEELEDQIRSITVLFAYLATEAAVHSRATWTDSGHTNITVSKIGIMTRAAAPMGLALAQLGYAVAQVGRLHEPAGVARTASAIKAERSVLAYRLDSARIRLNAAAAQLHRDADQLAALPPAGAGRPAAPLAGPTPRPPAQPASAALSPRTP
ncbi:hypothetical protein [Streptomyces sp. NPDC059928]|uniref:hypothetical protein n=1 Tax=unclassified Streptomyces TaxID=2593676 RepID=UPI003667B64D